MHRPQQSSFRPRFGRARAISLGRSRAHTHPAWLLPLLAAAALMAGMSLAGAQDSPPPASGTTASGTTAAPLAGGIIRPPAGIDPAIRKPPPVASSQLPTPVIKPQTENGDTIIQPK